MFKETLWDLKSSNIFKSLFGIRTRVILSGFSNGIKIRHLVSIVRGQHKQPPNAQRGLCLPKPLREYKINILENGRRKHIYLTLGLYLFRYMSYAKFLDNNWKHVQTYSILMNAKETNTTNRLIIQVNWYLHWIGRLSTLNKSKKLHFQEIICIRCDCMWGRNAKLVWYAQKRRLSKTGIYYDPFNSIVTLVYTSLLLTR